MEGKLLFSVLLTFLLQLASAKFNVEKSSLRVTSPESLKDVYGSAIGNFGVPKYGGTLNGGVVYPKSNQKACKSFDEFDLSFKPKPGGLPVFLLVDRGGKWSTRDFIFVNLLIVFLGYGYVQRGWQWLRWEFCYMDLVYDLWSELSNIQKALIDFT